MTKPKKQLTKHERLMKGKRLDPAQKFILLSWIEKTNEPYGSIAKKMGLSRQAVSAFAKRWGLREEKRAKK